jgi:hypothetical protein
MDSISVCSFYTFCQSLSTVLCYFINISYSHFYFHAFIKFITRHSVSFDRPKVQTTFIPFPVMSFVPSLSSNTRINVKAWACLLLYSILALWRRNFSQIILVYTNYNRTSQETHYATATKTNRLMLFRETVTVYCENCTQHTDTLFGQNVEL